MTVSYSLGGRIDDAVPKSRPRAAKHTGRLVTHDAAPQLEDPVKEYAPRTPANRQLVAKLPGSAAHYFITGSSDGTTSLWFSPSPEVDPGVIWPRDEQQRRDDAVRDAPLTEPRAPGVAASTGLRELDRYDDAQISEAAAREVRRVNAASRGEVSTVDHATIFRPQAMARATHARHRLQQFNRASRQRYGGAA